MCRPSELTWNEQQLHKPSSTCLPSPRNESRALATLQTGEAVITIPTAYPRTRIPYVTPAVVANLSCVCHSPGDAAPGHPYADCALVVCCEGPVSLRICVA